MITWAITFIWFGQICDKAAELKRNQSTIGNGDDPMELRFLFTLNLVFGDNTHQSNRLEIQPKKNTDGNDNKFENSEQRP